MWAQLSMVRGGLAPMGRDHQAEVCSAQNRGSGKHPVLRPNSLGDSRA